MQGWASLASPLTCSHELSWQAAPQRPRAAALSAVAWEEGHPPSGTQDRQMACPRGACLVTDTDRHHISSLHSPSIWVGAGALNPARSSVLSASHVPGIAHLKRDTGSVSRGAGGRLQPEQPSLGEPEKCPASPPRQTGVRVSMMAGGHIPALWSSQALETTNSSCYYTCSCLLMSLLVVLDISICSIQHTVCGKLTWPQKYASLS